MPKSKPTGYRLHWIEQVGESRIIRWLVVEGGADAAHDEALGRIASSVDGAIRIELIGTVAGDHVVTGRKGIEDWVSSALLPRPSANAWSRRIAERRRRFAAANEVKERLRSAVADGVLDLDGAARVASALEVALSVARRGDRPGSRSSQSS